MDDSGEKNATGISPDCRVCHRKGWVISSIRFWYAFYQMDLWCFISLGIIRTGIAFVAANESHRLGSLPYLLFLANKTLFAKPIIVHWIKECKEKIFFLSFPSTSIFAPRAT